MNATTPVASMSLLLLISILPLALRPLKNMTRMPEVHECYGEEHGDGIENVDEVFVAVVDGGVEGGAFATGEFDYAKDYSELSPID